MEENKYSRGKIYKIVSDHTDKIYIGSTCNELHKRMHWHRSSYKKYLRGNGHNSSADILQFDDAKIILMEKYPCEDRNELVARERYYFDLHRDSLCNQKKPAFYDGEKAICNKEWQAKYRENNKIMVNTKKQIYFESHPEIFKTKHTCAICGGQYVINNKSRHLKSKAHINKLTQHNQVE